MNYIIKFQEENNLVPDGVFGRHTAAKMKQVWGLTSKQSAVFLGQIAHESANFTLCRENLRYSAKALRRVFRKYFPTWEKAYDYAYQPRKIANLVYGNRLGNTDPEDGWKYRGRGALQLTGKRNYYLFAKFVGDMDILDNPDKICKKYYFETAIWYFQKRKLFNHITKTDEDTIRYITKKVNGGYNGLQHRINLTKHFALFY